MGLRVYVASKWENAPRVKEVATLLTLSGHTITYPWWEAEQETRVQAILDLRGVADCDVFVGVFERDLAYNGALVELGAALALGKPVYILGDAPTIKRCLFAKHPNIRRGDNPFIRDLLGGHSA